MKIFISYKCTGENLEELTNFMKKICSSLEKAGHEPLTTFWQKEEFEKNMSTMKDIMETALKHLDDSDCHLVIIKSNDKSEGMLIEAGYALAKGKRRITAIQKGIKTTWMRDIVNEVIEFEDIEDLCNKLKNLK